MMKTKHDKTTPNTSRINMREAGSVFTSLIGAVALVAMVNMGVMQTMSGPVTSMMSLNQNNMAKSQMMSGTKIIALEAVAGDNVDTDADGVVEPDEFTTGVTPTVEGGGGVPTGVTSTDPWGIPYAYCVWDHGSTDNGVDDAGANGTEDRLQGLNTGFENADVIALISAGPDGAFQTSCEAYDGAGTEGVIDPAGSDDIIIKYTYAEAGQATGGLSSSLWNLESALVTEIDKNVEIGTTSGTDVNFSLIGAANFDSIETDVITSRTTTAQNIEIDGSVALGHRIRLYSASGDPPIMPGDDAVANDFNFTNVAPVALNTQTISNIEQITGLSVSVSASISGDGSPEFRVCDDAVCGSVDHNWGSSNQSVDNDQYIQLRLTSDSNPATGLTATFSIGVKNDDWTVTTGSSCTGTTIALCTLPAADHDDTTPGTCPTAGSCSFTCDDGSFTPVTNTCS